MCSWCLLVVLSAVLVPTLATGQGTAVMLRLDLAACEAVVPGFPTERLATGTATVDGVTEARRWPTVPISLPESLADYAGLLHALDPKDDQRPEDDQKIVTASVRDGEVLANGAPLTPDGRVLITDLCGQLLEMATDQ